MKKYLLGSLILVILTVSVFYAFRNREENIPLVQQTETEDIEEKVVNNTNSNFELNYNVEQIKADVGSRTMVTYSVTVMGAESRSSGDWTLEIECPTGIVIGSVAGDQKCPADAQRVVSSLAYRFKNTTDSPQTVVAIARLLSGKDNYSVIATDTSSVIIYPSE